MVPYLITGIIIGALIGYILARCHIDRISQGERYELQCYRQSIRTIDIPLPGKSAIIERLQDKEEERTRPRDEIRIRRERANLWKHIGQN